MERKLLKRDNSETSKLKKILQNFGGSEPFQIHDKDDDNQNVLKFIKTINN